MTDRPTDDELAARLHQVCTVAVRLNAPSIALQTRTSLVSVFASMLTATIAVLREVDPEIATAYVRAACDAADATGTENADAARAAQLDAFGRLARADELIVAQPGGSA